MPPETFFKFPTPSGKVQASYDNVGIPQSLEGRILISRDVNVIGKWHLFAVLSGTYYQSASGRFYHFGRYRAEFINPQDSLNLDEEPLEEAKICTGDTDDSGDRLGVSEVGIVDAEPEQRRVSTNVSSSFCKGLYW